MKKCKCCGGPGAHSYWVDHHGTLDTLCDSCARFLFPLIQIKSSNKYL